MSEFNEKEFKVELEYDMDDGEGPVFQTYWMKGEQLSEVLHELELMDKGENNAEA